MSGKPASSRPAAALPPRRVRADGLARAAVIVGIVAFAAGWAPVLGFVIGAVGVILSLSARRRSNRPELGTTGLILSLVAVATNIVIDIFVVVSLVGQINNLTA